MHSIINDIRYEFAHLYREKIIKNNTLEIEGASFIVDDDRIFGRPNLYYIKAEIEWYRSQSLYVKDLFKIYGKDVKIWNDIKSKNGRINSNYGWMIFSEENGYQYINALSTLVEDRNSRRATMIYQRPTMHKDWKRSGMCDFTCTNAVTYHINARHELITTVQMRSNDAVFGFNNDVRWQMWVSNKLLDDLNANFRDKGEKLVDSGHMIWQAASLHVYERHFPLVQEYIDKKLIG